MKKILRQPAAEQIELDEHELELITGGLGRRLPPPPPPKHKHPLPAPKPLPQQNPVLPAQPGIH